MAGFDGGGGREGIDWIALAKNNGQRTCNLNAFSKWDRKGCFRPEVDIYLALMWNRNRRTGRVKQNFLA